MKECRLKLNHNVLHACLQLEAVVGQKVLPVIELTSTPLALPPLAPPPLPLISAQPSLVATTNMSSAPFLQMSAINLTGESQHEQQEPQSTPKPPPPPRVCHLPGCKMKECVPVSAGILLLTCSGCKRACYCTPGHQAAHYRMHRKECAQAVEDGQ